MPENHAVKIEQITENNSTEKAEAAQKHASQMKQEAERSRKMEKTLAKCVGQGFKLEGLDPF